MSLLRDLTYTFRTIRKQPLFAGIAVLTLALGIGANTAIFSVVNTVLLAPFAYPAEEPDEVIVLTETSRSYDEISVAYPNFKDWQRDNRSFEAMAGFRNTEYNLTGLDEPLRLAVRQVSHGYFAIMNVSPVAGRLFTPEEDTAGAPGVALLNYPLWQNRFGGSLDILGQSVSLEEEPYTVIGVLPAGLDLDTRERVYTTLEPWADNEDAQQRGNHQGIRVLARLRDGVTFASAAAEMETITAGLEAEYPDSNTGIRAQLDRFVDRHVDGYRATLWLLLGAVTLVLLVACTNVANLLLARSVGRQRDVAIQSALGASRRRLLQQALTEGVVLATFGGLLGIVFAFWGLRLLRGLLPDDIPRLQNVALDGSVLVYTLGLSIATGVVFGALPVLFGRRGRPADPLREGGRNVGGQGAVGRALLVVQVALATTLLIGAALLIRSIFSLTQVDPGFRSDHVLTMEVGVPYSRYRGEARTAFIREIREKMGALPGVRSASVGLVLPMLGAEWTSIYIVEGKPVPSRAELPSSIFTPVSPGHFDTFGIPLLRGRDFRESDDADAPDVVIVNQAFADEMWPNENPIGKRIKQGWPESVGESFPWREVVGVVGNVKQFGLDEETSKEVYIPMGQGSIWSVRIALRTETDPLTLAEPAKDVLHSMDPELPVFDVRTMEHILATSIAPRRFAMVLLGIFAAVALALAAIGLYGVIAYSVARRTQEIGVRMSIGAGRGLIFRLVLRQGMSLSLVGAACGVAIALLASRALESLLFGVGTTDVLSFAIVPLVLLVVAFAACTVPALAATRIDPIRALRYE